MPKVEFTCINCGLEKNANSWEGWLQILYAEQNISAQHIHIVRVMKPLVDNLAAMYFEPGPMHGVCGFCEAGGHYYVPDRHSEKCPAFVAWQVKPMMDQLLEKAKDQANG